MKHFLFLPAALCLAGVPFAAAQVNVVRSHSLSLDVTPVSAGDTVVNSTSNQNTSYSARSYSTNTRVTNSKESLKISVRNLGSTSDNAHVEWYFIAAPVKPEPGVSDDDQEFIFDQGAQDLALGAGGTQTIPAESVEVMSAVRNSSRGGSGGRSRRSSSFRMGGATQKPQESGSKLRGWMVRIVADGKVIAARGSSQTYEALVKDDAQLADLTDNKAPVNKTPGRSNYYKSDKPQR